jgi:uncharacterized membrane protein
MRIRILAPTLSLAAAVVFGLAGCNRESPKGGPGADKANKGTPGSDKADSFTIKVPTGNTNVTQGEQKEISISVSRGDKFDQDVKLTFKAPEGVQVTPDSVTAKKGGEDAKITVKAADTATVGTTNIKVTGTPATGSATTVDLGIEIKKK